MHWTRELRVSAYNKLRCALARGDIEPITDDCKCVDCGAPAKCFEHRNYFKPLDVDKVCISCNQQRGEGYPPLEGHAETWNGVEFNVGKGWSKLVEKTEFDKSALGASVKNRTSEWDEITRLYNSRMPLHRKLQYGDLSRYENYQLVHGDLRAEFFKQHDPYYEPATHGFVIG